MANIPSSMQYLNDIEVAQDAPITEALMNKLGGTVNALIDLNIGSGLQFTTSQTWSVPVEFVGRVLVIGSGGGGGGASANSTGAGNGGFGAEISFFYTDLVFGSSIPIVIGAGGGTGSAGQNSSFGSHSFYGAPGGVVSTGNYPANPRRPHFHGGYGAITSAAGIVGDFSPYENGGAAGAAGGGGGGGTNGGGGGGGASFGLGGAGGNGAVFGGVPAGNGGTGGRGAGGGGGGDRANGGVGIGGAGGDGLIIVVKI